MARVLIVGGGDRGLRLTRSLHREGHAVRVTTRMGTKREAIGAAGGECFIGTPERLVTLTGALEGVTIACWLLSCATGSREAIEALHASRLESFLSQIVDSTVRGFVYEAFPCALDRPAVERAVETVRALTSLNSIPLALIEANPRDEERWLPRASAAIGSLLE